jgi:DHA3 family macrolide efflux protein-like MFS transporter
MPVSNSSERLASRNPFISKNLFLLWAGQVISQFGDSLFTIGLAFLSLELTGSKTATGLVQMASYLPILIFGLFAGTIIDQTAKRRVMLVADFGRTFVLLVIPVLYFAKLLTPVTLALVAFMLTFFSTFFVPARNSFIPTLAGGNDQSLLKANSLMQTSEHIAFLVGPLAVGVLATLFGTIHLFTLDALTFALSFAFIFFITVAEPHQDRGFEAKQIFSDSVTGLKVVFANKKVFKILVLTSVNNLFLMGCAVVGTPIFIKDVLHKGVETYALIEFVFASAMLIMSFLMSVFAAQVKQMGYRNVWLFGIVVDGLTYLPYYFCTTVVQFAIASMLHGFCITLIIIPRTTLLQAASGTANLGKTFSLLNVSVSGMTAVSCAVTGIACEMFGVKDVFVVISLLAAACGVWGFFDNDLAASSESA